MKSKPGLGFVEREERGTGNESGSIWTFHDLRRGHIRELKGDGEHEDIS